MPSPVIVRCGARWTCPYECSFIISTNKALLTENDWGRWEFCICVGLFFAGVVGSTVGAAEKRADSRMERCYVPIRWIFYILIVHTNIPFDFRTHSIFLRIYRNSVLFKYLCSKIPQGKGEWPTLLGLESEPETACSKLTRFLFFI